VTTFADYARFYTSHPQYRHALDRWWNTPDSVRWDCCLGAKSVDEPPLSDLLGRIASAGYDSLCVDLTPPDLAPLGFRVVRALIPGLQPLHGNHAWPHLGGNRLRRLAGVFGPGTRQPWRWNPFPHPCP
jgi:ribosomal protein S12 methylthiotransferase accessory factor